MGRVKLIAVGDISLQTNNDENPFKIATKSFEDKDILFGNLETVLSSRGHEAEKAVSLYISPDKVRYLKDAGFDILNVANNHIMDLGPEGFNETLEVLNQNDLSFIGAGNIKFNQPYIIIERKDIKFGFLGYYQCGFRSFKESVFINRINQNDIVADIKNLKLQSDIVVISLHWGTENVFYPSPKQIKLARNLIDAGATLILGHHSHVIQGIERYKNGLIVYSLGNFQFKTKNKKTSKSIILFIEINKNKIEDYKIIPVRINENFIPCIMDNKEKQKMLSFIDIISSAIIKEKINERWWFEEIAVEYIIGNMKSWILRIKKYGIKHLLQCAKWLISPFVIKCYLGILRQRLRRHD